MFKKSFSKYFLMITSIIMLLFLSVPVHARYTGLIIDTRGIALERSMAPKVFNESGQEIYGSLPENASQAMMEKQSFFYAFDLNEALRDSADRTGKNPLTIKAIGAKMDDIYISNNDAALVLKEEKTGRFLAKQDVVVIVSRSNVTDPSIPAPSNSSAVTSLQEKLEKIRSMRLNPQSALTNEQIVNTTSQARPFADYSNDGVVVETLNTIPENAEIRLSSTSVNNDINVPESSLEPRLASIVKIRKNKVRLQSLDDCDKIRENAKFRVYRSILKSQPLGWIKILYCSGKNIEARIVEGESKIQLGDYVDLSEVNTVESFLDKFK